MSRKEERRYTSAKERAEKQSTGFSSASLKLPDNVTMFKPKAGTMLIDILPYEAGEGNPWAEEGNLHWERTYWVHRGIGANSDSVVCPRMTAKQACPICEARLKMMKAGDEDDEEMIKELAPKQRQLFNLINRKDPDKGVQLWDFSYFLFGKILDARLRNSEEDDGWDKFFFLEDGLSLKVGFEEETFGGHAFCKTETIDFKARSEDYDEDILKEVHNLDEIIEILPYDKLKKIFLEAREEKDDDEDEEAPKKKHRDSDEDDAEETPKKKHREEVEEDDDEPKAKKKAAPDDDDDDWGDFDEDEDKPKKKSKSKDDDEDEETEDEPEPKKKKKVVEDDDEDSDKDVDSEDDDGDDASTDDDEAPKKKNRFAKQKGDKGWEKDDDDDEDEEEKPRKRK